LNKIGLGFRNKHLSDIMSEAGTANY